MINSHWLNLTLFHYLPGAPATNNPLESYFSKSLKTDSKKQFRTDIGVRQEVMKYIAVKCYPIHLG